MEGRQGYEVGVLGGGPAGLTAAYVLAKQGRRHVVFEADALVGGIARTEVRDGYRFDLGGHRFFTKAPEVELLWHEVLGDELLVRPRKSRIYYNRRYLDYPLAAGNVVKSLGPVELTRAVASYGAALTRRRGREETFEEWVTNRFGRRLYNMFFRSYTEKVWGVPCTELRAEWAAQRIRGLSFAAAAKAAFRGNPGNQVKSLIEEFHYPRLGPGQMWEAMRDRIETLGGEVRMEARIDRLGIEDGRVVEVEANGEVARVEHVISSLPLAETALIADPHAPDHVRQAAGRLRYRDFMTVALAIDGEDPFPDNWVYVHDSEVKVARIQNFRAWSPDMVPHPGKSCVGMEYFCFEGEELWNRSDEDLVEMAATELDRIGLVKKSRVEKGWVVRVPKAYPIYDSEYAACVDTIRSWLDGITNLQQVGRNGLHRYNNSDHSMLTAMCAVANLDGAAHDVWGVNADSWYHESVHARETEFSPYLHLGRVLEELPSEV